MGADGAQRRPAVVRVAGRAGRLLAGGAGLTVRGLTGLVAPPGQADGPIVVVGTRLGEAALGLTALAGRRVLDVAAGVAMPVEAAASVMMRSGGSVARRTGVARRVDRLARIGRDEQRRNERMAAELLRSAWRRSVAQALAEADLEAALTGVDLDAIVARVDVDAVAARVDLDAVVERVGVPELVERVLDDVDLGRIVRESSAGMAAETVDAVRWRSAGADRALNGFIDRVVLRRSPRDGSRSPP